MHDPNTIFQRTNSGREEIYNKSHGLTQSERLVLIMTDGVTPYNAVRAKVPALTDERFDRAVTTLQHKELILEVFMPVPGQAAEQLESAVVDRFLQQDPLDPVTIIFTDPEAQIGLLEAMVTQKSPVSNPVKASVPSRQPLPLEPSNMGEDIVDIPPEELAELAAIVEQEVKARNSGRMPRPIQQVVIPVCQATLNPTAEQHFSLFKSLHWGYWMIGVGCAFIIGFLLAQMTF